MHTSETTSFLNSVCVAIASNCGLIRAVWEERNEWPQMAPPALLGLASWKTLSRGESHTTLCLLCVFVCVFVLVAASSTRYMSFLRTRSWRGFFFCRPSSQEPWTAPQNNCSLHYGETQTSGVVALTGSWRPVPPRAQMGAVQPTSESRPGKPEACWYGCLATGWSCHRSLNKRRGRNVRKTEPGHSICPVLDINVS